MNVVIWYLCLNVITENSHVELVDHVGGRHDDQNVNSAPMQINIAETSSYQ